jgi:hypothetical protein
MEFWRGRNIQAIAQLCQAVKIVWWNEGYSTEGFWEEVMLEPNLKEWAGSAKQKEGDTCQKEKVHQSPSRELPEALEPPDPIQRTYSQEWYPRLPCAMTLWRHGCHWVMPYIGWHGHEEGKHSCHVSCKVTSCDPSHVTQSRQDTQSGEQSLILQGRRGRQMSDTSAPVSEGRY